MAAIGDDEEELVKDSISPNADVFSYFMLTSPSEQKKHSRFTLDAFTSYMLVFLVLFIQGMLLFCVSHKVIAKSIQWQNGIMNTGKDWNMFVEKQSGCNDGRSLCTSENGMFTCSPPSIQLIGRWDELDIDKDDTWTRDEVMSAREALSCKYAVDPVEVFDVLIALLMERKKHIWLHHDVKNGTAIPKMYFTYIMGDVAMCGYRNGDMCGNLVQRGFFDAALKHGRVPRVGTTVMSALQYCHDLLDSGGLCERFLPSTYSTWKIESVQECEAPQFKKFVYKDPNSDHLKSLLSVDYEARQNYETAKTPVFKVYKICIIFLWMLLIVSQLREVSKTITWVLQIRTPTPEEEDEERAERARAKSLSRQRSELKAHEIHTISRTHRVALAIVTLVRIGMLCVLLYVGLNFLGRQNDYIGLLLDGVALIFIVEVEEIIYARVLRSEVRTTWEERDAIELLKMGPLAGRADIVDLLWLGFVALMAIVFLLYYTTSLVEPLYESLQCACLSQGETCREASVFSRSFWDQYWKHDVPLAIDAIKALKESLPLKFWIKDLKDAHPVPLFSHHAQVGLHHIGNSAEVTWR